mgnify:CR=1 FL=1
MLYHIGPHLINKEKIKIKELKIKSEINYLIVDDFITDSFLSKARYHSMGYSCVTQKIFGRSQSVMLHRIIMNAPEGKQVDHINGNKLDNRIENLRIVDQTQNNYNTKLRVDNKSKEKCISFCDENGKRKSYTWRFSFSNKGKNIQKRFNSKEDAIKYRDEYLGKLNELYRVY